MTEEEIRNNNLVGIDDVKALYRPDKASHKGQNGKLLIIGGSHLFHGASLWALKAASRVVDMVFYASVPENLRILDKIKGEVLDFIAIPRSEIEEYIDEADAVLIGPGMVRPKGEIPKNKHQITNKFQISNLNDLNEIDDEGEQTRVLTNYLLHKYPKKQWVIDAGAIQVMEVGWIPRGAVLTPHLQEFELLKIKNQKSPPKADPPRAEKIKNTNQNSKISSEEEVKEFAKEHSCIVLLKGARDIISNGEEVKYTVGGNAGMTKGGTGDVLAGLAAAFACKNEPFLAARAGSFLNKLAGDMLYKKVNTMFNASDLCEAIPEAYKYCLDYVI